MQLGMVGLGRMGANMVRRLMRAGHQCVVFDLNPANIEALKKEGAIGCTTLDDFVQQLAAPRHVWVMVPSGEPTEKAIGTLGELMKSGDTIIDGGNSYFKDDIRRGASLAKKGIRYVDVGTSGGIWGIDRGYCMMVGGDPAAVKELDPILKSLAPGRGEIERTPGWEKRGGTAEEGYLYCGPFGAGHFVKMVHNGIEYGLMQAYAEGFDIFENAGKLELNEGVKYSFKMDEIAEVWRRGSVVSSWLLDLTSQAFAEDEDLKGYSGVVADSGEGRWTIMTAIEEAVPADVLSAALYVRFRSRQDHTFAEKVLSAMRQKFGGHIERATGG